MVKQQNKKNNSKKFAIIFIIILIVIIGTVGILSYISTHKTADFRYYFAFGDDTVSVQDDKYVQGQSAPIIEDDTIYISFSYIKANIDKYIYWDDALQKLTITNTNDVIRFEPEADTYLINGEEYALDEPIKLFNSEPYLPQSLIESVYNIKINYIESNNIVVIHNLEKDTNYTTLKRNTILRYAPSSKDVIEHKLLKGETVQIFDEYDDYTKVMTSEGLVGYVRTKNLNSKNIETIKKVEPIKSEYENKEFEGRINLVWDNITNQSANSLAEKKVNQKGVNVLCPTWFKFDRNKLDGTIISYADKDYVDYAHDNGYMVWGLVSDVADSYDTVVLENILPNTDYRDRAIEQLLYYMDEYDLDGINVDFEVLPVDCGDDYLQFFRELYPAMKREGKYLSVDTYVPSDWSLYFNREDVAKSVDYFIIMAYDEHNSSTDAGAVASYDFVEKGIKDSLEIIPKEKLVLGMPMYTRVWKEYEQDGQVITEYVTDLAMDSAKRRFDNNNATYTYDDSSGYTYGEYTNVVDGNTVTYKAWLEDVNSIKDKVELANKYDIKGVASWRRGLEGDGIFEIIDDTLNE